MRWIPMLLLGLLVMLVGCVWFLQGIGVLPGSFMTGQLKWAIYGALSVLVGIGLVILANRQRVRRSDARPPQ